MPDYIAHDEVLARFQVALARLLSEDQHLLIYDVSERSITHKLAEYLQPLFPGWHVDCEYNRNGHDPKRVNLPHSGQQGLRPRSIYPDIIVHQRGVNSRNLLIVEAKKTPDGRVIGADYDRQKLVAYASQLNYQVGIFLVLRTGKTDKNRAWYSLYSEGQWHLPQPNDDAADDSWPPILSPLE